MFVHVVYNTLPFRDHFKKIQIFCTVSMSKFTLLFFFWLFVLEWNKWRTWYVCVQCIFLMLPFWISFECIFLDSGCSYILLEDSLMSRNIRSLNPFWFPVYRYISVPVHAHVDLDLQLLIHGQYCRSCPVWDGGGSWAGHHPPTAPPPQRGQQTSPGVSKYFYTYRVSKSGWLLTMKCEET